MELNIPFHNIQGDPVAAFLLQQLETNGQDLLLDKATVFYQFPIYKELDGDIVKASILIVSENYGIITFGLFADSAEKAITSLSCINAELEQLVSLLFSRLLRNKELRKDKVHLKFPISSCIYAPSLENYEDPGLESEILINDSDLFKYIKSIQITPLDEITKQEIISTIDGSKALIRKKDRKLTKEHEDTKGGLIVQLESEIALFDKKQRHGYSIPVDGPQRIRGLAGSGKTVILAMKAAQTHLQYPDKQLLFTFYTKSLYQHVKRLITRFYRQYDDKDPNWDVLHVMHAWGGKNVPGVYYEACRYNNIRPMSFIEAKTQALLANKEIFQYICSELIRTCDINTMYDYIFVDEGQDFCGEFINLCRMLAVEERVVWAYDELQNIFNVKIPSPGEVFGTNAKGEPLSIIRSDIVLHKCYRNPREIIVCAHALGFGIYSDKIVQMLENRDHWVDVGYIVKKGNFTPGSDTEIFRPEEHTTLTVSNNSTIDDIIKCESFGNLEKEVKWVSRSIEGDLKQGLKPDDILIIIVDDRNFKVYAEAFRDYFRNCIEEIGIYNTQNDFYGVLEFQQDNCITISTINKAKGNEAYMVYVVGIDSLFTYHSVRNRNKIFTAMTRAKAWVRLTGLFPLADMCKKEIDIAKRNIPYIKFKYPTHQEITVMRRDLSAAAIKEQEADRMIDDLLQNLSEEELKARITSKVSTRKYKRFKPKGS